MGCTDDDTSVAVARETTGGAGTISTEPDLQVWSLFVCFIHTFCQMNLDWKTGRGTHIERRSRACQKGNNSLPFPPWHLLLPLSPTRRWRATAQFDAGFSGRQKLLCYCTKYLFSLCCPILFTRKCRRQAGLRLWTTVHDIWALRKNSLYPAFTICHKSLM